jgi:ABC-type transporter Mla subunit MlaD
MDENVLEQLEEALGKLNTLLDDTAVKTALGAIPDAMMNPVIEGLKQVLGVIQDALDELKENLPGIGDLQEFLDTVNSLLEAAEGLAPGQQSTLETVKNIVKTLQDLPGADDIERILGMIDGIIDKLEAL